MISAGRSPVAPRISVREAAMATSRSEEASCKGSNFVGLLRALDKHDASARLRILPAMSPALASAVAESQFMSIGWYPISQYAELHAAVDSTLHGGATLARKLSFDATTSDFGSVHRLIASMLKIETVFGQAHRLMGLYFKGGEIEFLELERGRARIRFARWHGFSRLVWEDLTGAMEAILTVAGAKDIRVRSTSASQASDAMDFELRWSS